MPTATMFQAFSLEGSGFQALGLNWGILAPGLRSLNRFSPGYNITGLRP
jgi:hypothetical protein